MNTKLDCDDPFPNNEPNIEVDPANPLHMIASSNDYGTCCDENYTTFDSGKHVGEQQHVDGRTRQSTGSDPVTVFDASTGRRSTPR